MALFFYILYMKSLVILGALGAQEIIFIALIILVFFGGKKIPELMRGLGKGVREYNKAVNSIKGQFDGINEDINSSKPKDEKKARQDIEKQMDVEKDIDNISDSKE